MNPLNHVAIIMDGNGRWGIENKNSRNAGHKEGLKVIVKLIESCIKHQVRYLTLYAFSTENWKRPTKEVDYLFNLLKNFLKKKINFLKKKKIKLKILGKKLPYKKLNNLIKNCEKITSNNKVLQINLALNYGSRNELVYAFKNIKKKKLQINEQNIINNLYTKDIPDPEILIRTGNSKRLSNFLLWQLSYTEIFFIKKLWPEFTHEDFEKIIKDYKKIVRNFGAI